MLSGVAHQLGVENVNRQYAIICGFALVGPLSCFKHLNGLRFFAMVTLLIIVWTTLMTVLFFFRAGPAFEPCAMSGETLPCHGATFGTFPDDITELGKRASAFIFAFVCQMNIFTICNEVADTSPIRTNALIVIAHLVAGGLMFAAGLFSYATYGTQVQPDMLMSYPNTRIIGITRLLYIVVAVVSFPVQAHPCRQAALALFGKLVPPAASISRGGTKSWWAVTIGILLSSLIVGLLVDDLGIVYGLVGGTASTAVSYIIPAHLYIRTCPTPHLKRTLAIGLLALGWTIIPVSSILVILF